MILDPSELRTARLARGLTQQRLAAASGLNVGVIQRIERSLRANTDTMRCLTGALGIVVQVPEVSP